MKKRISKTAAAALFLSLLLTGCGGNSNETTTAATSGGSTTTAEKTSEDTSAAAGGDVITLKMGTKMGADSQEGKGFQKFADLVAEKTGGSVEVVVYPSEQLGDSTTQINNLAMGTQELYAEGCNYFSGYTNLLEVSNIPYLFENNEQYLELVQSDFGKQQEAILEDNGFKILNTNRDWIRGPFRVLCSSTPIQSLDDVKGLRLRSYESDIYMKCWSALGAEPIVISWTETYLALQQGTVSAVASPISMVEDMAFTEVAPHVSFVKEFPQEIVVVMNKKVFDGLTAEQQEACIEAANEAATWSNDLLNAETDASIKRMEDAGATFYDIDTKPFTEALLDYFRELEANGTMPEGLLERLGY